MLRAILNKSWKQHPTKQQLYGLLPPITKTIQVRWTRHAGHCYRSREELISDVLLWTPSHGQAKSGEPARTYIQQLFADTVCSSEDLPEAMNDTEVCRERVKDICTDGTTRWDDEKCFTADWTAPQESVSSCMCHKVLYDYLQSQIKAPEISIVIFKRLFIKINSSRPLTILKLN